MKRRQFSLSASALATAAAVGLSTIPLASQAQALVFKSGKDYLTLDKPAMVQSPAGKIEVIEFFWYNCPHCNVFEPTFDAWSKKAPADVVIRRTPVAFRADFEPQQRLYYALEGMGKLDELHKKVFHAIHVEKQTLNTAEQITAWVEKQGVVKVKFLELYNSFFVANQARKAKQLQDAYQVDGVPSLGIHGKYFTSGSQAKTLERALQVTDFLIIQSRAKA